MNEFLERIAAAVRQRFQGPEFSNFLERFGVHPKRFWLLLDLFDKLSKRGEMQNELGRERKALKISTVYLGLFSGIGVLIAVVAQARAWVFAAVMLGFMVLMLVSTLLSEAANSLVNPEEALSLSHQPINGATYTAAKLSHLLRIVLFTVVGLHLLPSLAMPLLPGGNWFYTPLDLFLALLVGVLLALFCCSIFGLLMRIIPARRMKAAAQFVQAIPLAIYGLFRFAPRGTLRSVLTAAQSFLSPLAHVPIWLLATVSGTTIVAVTVIGLRSLSADYLIRASSMVHGHSTKTTKVRRSFLGEIVSMFFGGQGGRAGFDYMKRMLLRDWQFRRRLLGFIPMMIGALLGVFGSGLRSPFDSEFSGVHFLPHALGFVLYMSCLLMAFGTDYKGTWLFMVISDRVLIQFARGVHAALWLMFVVVPNAVAFPLFAWRWGIGTAAVFSLFSVAASSVYLSFGLRNIDGIPFGKQVRPGKETSGQGGARIIAFMIVALISVGVQYLIFRSEAAVAVATIVLGVAAVFLTRWSLRNLETALRHHIGTLSQTSSMLYTEVNIG